MEDETPEEILAYLERESSIGYSPDVALEICKDVIRRTEHVKKAKQIEAKNPTLMRIGAVMLAWSKRIQAELRRRRSK